ncbi:MAG: DENN domain-containing protein [archaeon]|nr:DENN domain-containing protein [archaeon]
MERGKTLSRVTTTLISDEPDEPPTLSPPPQAPAPLSPPVPRRHHRPSLSNSGPQQPSSSSSSSSHSTRQSPLSSTALRLPFARGTSAKPSAPPPPVPIRASRLKSHLNGYGGGGSRSRSMSGCLFEFVVRLELLSFVSSTEIRETYRYVSAGDSAAQSSRSLATLIDACPHFSFPDRDQFLSPDKSHMLASERFSFVITDPIGMRFFGYVLRYFESPTNQTPRAFVICSSFQCFALFSHMLQELVRRSIADPEPRCLQRCSEFLQSVRACAVPEPGEQFQIPSFSSDFLSGWKFTRPDETDAPLEHIDFQPLLRRFKPKILLQIFCSMLLERRFIFLARHLSTLCSVVQAAVALLYPCSWHHAYIPVMPKSMVDICGAPIPFIVGMQTATFSHVKQHELEADVLVIDIDSGQMLTPPNSDVDMVPKKLISHIRSLLVSLGPDRTLAHRFRKSVATMTKLVDKKEGESEEPVDLIPPKEKTQRLLAGFLTFFVTLLSGYRNHFRPTTRLYDFDKAGFIAGAHPDLNTFLSEFVETQLFEQFIASRAQKYSTTTALKGTFDKRASSSRQSLYFQDDVLLTAFRDAQAGTSDSQLLSSLDLEVRPSRFSKFHDTTEVSSLLSLAKRTEASSSLQSNTETSTSIKKVASFEGSPVDRQGMTTSSPMVAPARRSGSFIGQTNKPANVTFKSAASLSQAPTTTTTSLPSSMPLLIPRARPSLSPTPPPPVGPARSVGDEPISIPRLRPVDAPAVAPVPRARPSLSPTPVPKVGPTSQESQPGPRLVPRTKLVSPSVFPSPTPAGALSPAVAPPPVAPRRAPAASPAAAGTGSTQESDPAAPLARPIRPLPPLPRGPNRLGMSMTEVKHRTRSLNYPQSK